MIRSMTGYGNVDVENEHYLVNIEIKSVNHRYNNISIRMPHHINHLEDRIRKEIKEKLKRGSIDVFINLEYLDDTDIDVRADLNLAKAYYKAFSDIQKDLNIEDKIGLEDIVNMPEVIKRERKDIDDEKLSSILFEGLEKAISQVVEMRKLEGENLKKDILEKILLLEGYLSIIEGRSSTVVVEYKEKLEAKIKNLLDDNIPIDEDRLSNEIAYFADKSSIDEEIVRIKSHLDQVEQILDEEDVIGRKLDFVIQELNREINTIGSKSSDVKISENVVNFKSELEKIREQVQNIE